jgi:branched-chain amino acid transport system substrate-binding protein
MKRRTLAQLAVMAVVASISSSAAFAQDVIKVGAVAPKTGPLAGGSEVSYWPNVHLWVSDAGAD